MIDSIRNNMAWAAVPVAALAAGSVFMAVILALPPVVLEIDPTLYLSYIAALVQGNDVLVDPVATTPIVGIVVHYVLSLVFTALIAIVVHRWGLIVGVVGGAILGLSLYAINFYFMTRFVEWFSAIDGGVMVLAHLLFGMVAGGVYELLDTYDQPIVEGEQYA
jgi:hypothetical protein